MGDPIREQQPSPSKVVGGGGSGRGTTGGGASAENHLSQAEVSQTSGDDKEHLPASQRMSLPST